MFNAFKSLLRESDQGAIIIGSDCLDLTPGHLREAARALGNHDLVLAPALDGGYALIGCNRVDPELFRNIHWSTDRVLQQTLGRAESIGYRVCLLETLRDIDTLPDVENYPELLALVKSS